jgi:hypothetical protein
VVQVLGVNDPVRRWPAEGFTASGAAVWRGLQLSAR